MTLNITIEDSLANQLEAVISTTDKQQRYPKGLQSWFEELTQSAFKQLIVQQVSSFPDVHKEIISIQAKEAEVFRKLADKVSVTSARKRR